MINEMIDWMSLCICEVQWMIEPSLDRAMPTQKVTIYTCQTKRLVGYFNFGLFIKQKKIGVVCQVYVHLKLACNSYKIEVIL